MILDHKLSLKKTTMSKDTEKQKQEQEVEKPPPYTYRSNSLPGPPGASGSSATTLTTSSLRPPPKLPPRHASSATSLMQSRTPETPATVNQIHLFAKNEDIIGTFYVDPQTPRQKSSKLKKMGKRTGEIPHASFSSRGGGMHLTLGSAGDIRQTPKANVQVSSKSGNIEITLIPSLPSKPRIGLDVMSRKGDIMVYLPPTFSGLLQLNTRHGQLHILPALSKLVKVLKATDKEMIVLVGTDSKDDNSLTDLCQLQSRGGKVMIGLSGEDRPVEKQGFWAKLGSMFRVSP